MLSELAVRSSMRTPLPLLLGIEALLIVGYMCCGNWFIHAGKLVAPQELSWSFVLLTMLLTGAMGIQTAALQHIGSHSVHTTFVTGMLMDLARQSASFLLRVMKKLKTQKGGVPETPQPTWSWLLVEIWVVYVAGAVAGTYGLNHLSIKVLLIPLLLLVFLIVMALRRSTDPV